MKKFKINGKGLVGTINKKQMKKGSYSIAITAIVIAIVIAANLVMAEIPSQYTQVDVSEQKLYTISDETQKLLNLWMKMSPCTLLYSPITRMELWKNCWNDMRMLLRISK